MKTEVPQVTIVILFYNQEKYVAELLDNIRASNKSANAKVVIVDDCSLDNTFSLIEDWLQKNYQSTWKVIRNSSNLGISSSILKAIKVVDTKWVKCHAGDDTFAPGGIEEFISLSKKYDPEKDIIMTAVNIINESNEIIGCRNNPSYLTFSNFFKDVNYYTNNLMAFSVLAGTKAYKKAISSMYFKNAEDWPLLIYSIKKNFSFKLIKKRLINYRIHDKSIMSFSRNSKLDLTESQKQLKIEIIDILKKNLQDAPTLSSKYGTYIQLLEAKYSLKKLNFLFKILKLFNFKYLLFRLLTLFIK